MPQLRTSLAKLLNDDTMIDVVEIGANPIDGDPPYKGLLDARHARLDDVEGIENIDFLKIDQLGVSKPKKRTLILQDVVLRALTACDTKSVTSYAQGHPAFLGQPQQ